MSESGSLARIADALERLANAHDMGSWAQRCLFDEANYASLHESYGEMREAFEAAKRELAEAKQEITVLRAELAEARHDARSLATAHVRGQPPHFGCIERALRHKTTETET